MISTPPPLLSRFIDDVSLHRLIETAKLEDLGAAGRDLTSERFIPAESMGAAQIQARRMGVMSGGVLLPIIAGCYDPSITTNVRLADGGDISPGDTIAELSGNMRSLLAFERVALNFLMHLCGVATTTAAYVKAADGQATICDTRKTIPGMRGLQKYAVACGGGCPHRFGLYDAVLVKDNHLGSSDRDKVERVLTGLLALSPSINEAAPEFIEVEVDHLDQLRWVLGIMADHDNAPVTRIVLLDNMTTQMLKEAVSLRDEVSPGVLLEASGGITLDSVPSIAETGVDRIAVGALTHSAVALDIGMDM